MNWKVRLKNKTFWISFIPAVLLLVQVVAAVFGFQLELGGLGDKLLNVVNALFAVLTREQIARDAKLDEQLSNMNKNIEKLLVKQEVCDAKPAKRWESVVAAAISAIVSGLVVFLLTRVGLQ